LVLRFFGDTPADDRLLLVNLGYDFRLSPAPEPLLAPPVGQEWEMRWSSEDPRYGGCGMPALETDNNWRLPGQAAVVLRPRPRENDHAKKERG
jgi:maltooligosyltrehalose trehalohydrolase